MHCLPHSFVTEYFFLFHWLGKQVSEAIIITFAWLLDLHIDI